MSNWNIGIFGTGLVAVLLVVAVTLSETGSPRDSSEAPRAREEGKGFVLDLYQYDMAALPSGKVRLGSPDDEPYRSRAEVPHEGVVPRGFLLGTTEVTQAFWSGVTGRNPAEDQVYGYKNELCGRWGVGETLPVMCVTFDEVVTFLNVLSGLEKLTPAYRLEESTWVWDRDADGYRLPTEREWAYAARAGTSHMFSGTALEDDPCGVGNLATRATKDRYSNWLTSKVFECEDPHLHLAPVKSYAPNAWGLFDMTGNVREWVWDPYVPYPNDPSENTVAADWRVTRGGGWTDGKRGGRVAARTPWNPADRQAVIGFRIARNFTGR